jgi:hypothetical protein
MHRSNPTKSKATMFRSATVRQYSILGAAFLPAVVSAVLACSSGNPKEDVGATSQASTVYSCAGKSTSTQNGCNTFENSWTPWESIYYCSTTGTPITQSCESGLNENYNECSESSCQENCVGAPNWCWGDTYLDGCKCAACPANQVPNEAHTGCIPTTTGSGGAGGGGGNSGGSGCGSSCTADSDCPPSCSTCVAGFCEN